MEFRESWFPCSLKVLRRGLLASSGEMLSTKFSFKFTSTAISLERSVGFSVSRLSITFADISSSSRFGRSTSFDGKVWNLFQTVKPRLISLDKHIMYNYSTVNSRISVKIGGISSLLRGFSLFQESLFCEMTKKLEILFS